MSRYNGPVCKLCRREGEKLFLKGSRCDSAKCAIVKRNFQPGVHPWSRGRPSDYGVRLREKQKLKRYFGMTEKSFRRVYQKAYSLEGNTGENMLRMLLRRLDNVVNELGLTASRRHARQLLSHGHVYVNGRRCDVASAAVRAGDRISISKKEKVRKMVKEAVESRKASIPAWLKLDESTLDAQVVELPRREHLEFPVDEQLVVELMSK